MKEEFIDAVHRLPYLSPQMQDLLPISMRLIKQVDACPADNFTSLLTIIHFGHHTQKKQSRRVTATFHDLYPYHSTAPSLTAGSILCL